MNCEVQSFVLTVFAMDVLGSVTIFTLRECEIAFEFFRCII